MKSKKLEVKDAPKPRVYLCCSKNSKWKSQIESALKYYEVSCFDPSSMKNKEGSHVVITEEYENRSDVHLYFIDKEMCENPYMMGQFIDSCFMAASEYYCEDCMEFHKEYKVNLVLTILETEGMSQDLKDSVTALILKGQSRSKEYTFMFKQPKDEDDLKKSISQAAEIVSGMKSVKCTDDEDD